MYIVESRLLFLVHDGLIVPVVKKQDVRFSPIVEGGIVGGGVSFSVLEEDVRVVVQQQLDTVQTTKRATLHESGESVIVLHLTRSTKGNLLIDLLNLIDHQLQDGSAIFTEGTNYVLPRVM